MTTQVLDAGFAPPNVQITKRLPFEIRVATTPGDIAELVSVRSETYARHKAPGAEFLKAAESQDGAPDAILLIARAKIGGGVVGSVRIQTRLVHPLMVESAMALPSNITTCTPVELMRGSVRGGTAGRMVSAALAKASFLMAIELGFTHIIVTCREPVDSMYRAYRFDDLLGGTMINLPYSPGAPHRVLCLPVAAASDRWRSNNLPLHEFMIGTVHPDIQLDFELAKDGLRRAAESKESVEA
ncbi:MAG: hypothetical protein ABIZ18_08005 [Caldimonas sp.]